MVNGQFAALVNFISSYVIKRGVRKVCMMFTFFSTAEAFHSAMYTLRSLAERSAFAN
jgi:NADH:ubiquinone oxidoreductase subunit 4 (subunit M)